MSVETQKPVEETPVTKTIPTTETPEAPKATQTPAVAEATVAAAIKTDDAAPAPATENPTAQKNTVVAAIPASEGTLGYKEHGFLKSLRYSKHFFWFGEEAYTSESLAQFVKTEKFGHPAAAWAQETGKGVLFYAKRAEDKATPSGVIVLADASTVLEEGTTEFSFTIGKIHHRFQANTSAERDSWIVALGKKVEEAQALKDEILGRESYQKTMEGFGPTAAATRSSSKGPTKTLDTAPATTAGTTEAPANAETVVTSSSDADKKAKKEAEKSARKERSQSRKRASIFGMLGKKDEEKEIKKEEKEAKKEQIKEEKKEEAEHKKEEAKATHEPSKAVEAAEAAAVAAGKLAFHPFIDKSDQGVVPAAAIAAAEKKEDKKEEEVTTPTEKKNKRASVFGSFFGKKSVTSPTTETTEKEATAPIVPAKDSEVPPVSETAPKLDEPIENKPIDTAAVTAPVDLVETPAATTAPVEEPVKESPAVPETETAAPQKTEKKGGFLAGFMKKAEPKKEEKKEEAKEEKAAEQIAKDPVAAAAVPTTDGAADVATEIPAVVETPAEAKEDRTAREKRRTSFFSGFGTKKKTDNVETEGAAATEVKREKSPLPGKLGGMFRKPSKAVKPTETATEPEVAATESAVPAATTTTDVPESKIVGDVVPESLTADVHNAVTMAPEASEVKPSA